MVSSCWASCTVGSERDEHSSAGSRRHFGSFPGFDTISARPVDGRQHALLVRPTS